MPRSLSRPRRVKLVVNYVFDDSGGYSDTEFISIAGYAAQDEQWDSFMGEWETLLLRHGLPYMHMRELIPLQGPYKKLGWDYSKRDAVLAEFIALIKLRMACGFAVALDARYYRKMSKEAKELIGNPHRFCVIRLIGLIRKIMASIHRENDPITLVFDDSEEFSVMYHGIIRDLRKSPEYRKLIGSVCFTDDDIYTPLQAADILAWGTTKELSQKLGGFKSRKDFEDLVGIQQPEVQLPYKSEHYGPEALDDCFRKLQSKQKNAHRH